MIALRQAADDVSCWIGLLSEGIALRQAAMSFEVRLPTGNL